MEEPPLGATGLTVPVVGMGTWRTFDVRGPAEANVARVVDAAVSHGMRLFDSSPMYGEAGRVLGAALSGRRDGTVVATKVWTSDDAEAARQVAFSLRAFGGQVELYQVHNLVRWERRLDDLERLRADGAVTAIGATHYQSSAFGESSSARRTRMRWRAGTASTSVSTSSARRPTRPGGRRRDRPCGRRSPPILATLGVPSSPG